MSRGRFYSLLGFARCRGEDVEAAIGQRGQKFMIIVTIRRHGTWLSFGLYSAGVTATTRPMLPKSGVRLFDPEGGVQVQPMGGIGTRR